MLNLDGVAVVEDCLAAGLGGLPMLRVRVSFLACSLAIDITAMLSKQHTCCQKHLQRGLVPACPSTTAPALWTGRLGFEVAVCKQLQELHLSRCHHITGIAVLQKVASQLRGLHLSFCFRLDWRCFQALTRCAASRGI